MDTTNKKSDDTITATSSQSSAEQLKIVQDGRITVLDIAACETIPENIHTDIIMDKDSKT